MAQFECMACLWEGSADELEDLDDADGVDESSGTVHCPECGSDKVEYVGD